MMRLLEHSVREQAEVRPDALAVTDGSSSLSYEELEASANRLAHALTELGCQPGERICLLLPKAPETITAIIAVLKAGGVYVPLDVESPPARLAKIVGAVDPLVVVTVPALAGALSALRRECDAARNARVIWLGDAPKDSDIDTALSSKDISAFPTTDVATANTDAAPAYIMFTSGSTGNPKGVVITRANVASFVEWAVEYFGITSDDRASGYSPLHFDLSVFDVFGTFAAGASLHLVSRETALIPRKLAEFVRRSKLTQWFSVPSLLTYLAQFDVVEPETFATLRRLMWCGERFPTTSLIYWMRQLPNVRFTNLYGPTETTIASSYYTVPSIPDDACSDIPIGRACGGEELLILNQDMRPVPTGVPGDLFIRGKGVSPGYWRDDEKTEASFVRDPFGANPQDKIYKTGDLARWDKKGQAYFLGRADSQIKSRGFRIELGEIEAALHEIVAIKECAVVAEKSSGFEGTMIHCAYVLAEGDNTTPAQLRTGLRRHLPPYMLPQRWTRVAVLPRNANGKIDRQRLAEEACRITPE